MGGPGGTASDQVGAGPTSKSQCFLTPTFRPCSVATVKSVELAGLDQQRTPAHTSDGGGLRRPAP